MLSVGLWCTANNASKDLLKGADLEEEQSPKKMPDISSIPEAKMLIVEPVQNAAGNEWRDAKIALEESQMMVDLWVDLFVEDLPAKRSTSRSDRLAIVVMLTEEKSGRVKHGRACRGRGS